MRLNTLHNEIENHIEESEKLLQNLRSLESEKHLGMTKNVEIKKILLLIICFDFFSEII